jgi:hypothetical protein
MKRTWSIALAAIVVAARRLEQQLAIAGILRGRLAEGDDPTMTDFLDWFEKWFLRRGAPVEVEAKT